MSNQDILRKRATLLSELNEIVQAMKNVAFAELQRVTRERQALAQALAAVAGGLARCEDGTEVEGTPASHTRWLVIGAERGFCGTFNARLLEAARSLREDDPQARVLLASRRAGDQLDAADAAGDAYAVLPGCTGVEEAPTALDGWLAALDDEGKPGREAWVLYTADTGLARRRLLPIPDLAGLGPVSAAPASAGLPAHYLPLPALRAALRRQTVRLLLQSALYASLEQENRARLTQMQLAHEHLERLGATLRRRQAALRQADITNELETLTSVLSR